jgi:hypothetical protein
MKPKICRSDENSLETKRDSPTCTALHTSTREIENLTPKPKPDALRTGEGATKSRGQKYRRQSSAGAPPPPRPSLPTARAQNPEPCTLHPEPKALNLVDLVDGNSARLAREDSLLRLPRLLQSSFDSSLVEGVTDLARGSHLGRGGGGEVKCGCRVRVEVSGFRSQGLGFRVRV